MINKQLTPYEFKVIRLARDKIIQILTDKNYTNTLDYKVTAAGANNSYRLTFSSHHALPFYKYQTEIVDIGKKLGEAIKAPKKPIVIVTSSAGGIVVDTEEFVKEYISLNQTALDIEEEISSPSPNPVVKKEEVKEKVEVPKKVEEKKVEIIQPVNKKIEISPKEETAIENRRTTLLSAIRLILQQVMPMSELQKQYILKKYEGGNNDTAEIQINNPRTMHKALRILEAKGYFVGVIGIKLIAGFQKRVIDEIPGHQRLAPAVQECVEFLANIQAWMDKNEIVGEILSHPYLLVQSNYSEELEIQCANGVEAEIVEQLFIVNGIPVRSNVRMVYVRLSRPYVIKAFIDATVKRKEIEVANRIKVLGLENPENRIIQESHDYSSFNFLPFNRPRDKNHVRWINGSIDEFGIVGIVWVAETDCIDGVMKKWIVDGQHTFTAEMNVNKPIYYLVIPVSSKLQLVRLIAVLNNRRKQWKLENYLDAWKSIDIPVYDQIYEWVINKKMPFSLVLETISGRDSKAATADFKDGNFRADGRINADQILAHVFELKKLLSRSSRVHLVLARFIRETKDFDVERMRRAIKRVNIKAELDPDDGVVALAEKMKILYQQAA